MATAVRPFTRPSVVAVLAAAMAVGATVAPAPAIALQVAAVATRRLPTLGLAVRAATRQWPALRWLLLAGWLWVGWHVFARADL